MTRHLEYFLQFTIIYNNLQYLLGNHDQNIYQNQALLRDLS